jgi:4-aminobutyrate aminotransferase-like enzyme
MGKPIGNGHPLAALVTTREIAEAFHNGMEYFNTFGGNPVSCAVGLAVLEVIEGEGLQGHALEIGKWLIENLLPLKEEFQSVGDVRGSGLFLGIELVSDHETLEPATELAHSVVQRMRERRILLSTDGPLENVIKFKPPMVFSMADAERLVMTLRETLKELNA